MKIFIPTIGRPDKQPTWDSLPKRWQENTMLVCPIAEFDHHRRHDRNVLVHPAECKGIGPVRQWIVEQAQAMGLDKFLMMDDDHRYYVRKAAGDWHLRYSTEEETGECMDMLESLLDTHMHVGLSARQGNNRHLDPIKHVTRQNNVHGFRTKVFKKHPEVSYTADPVMQVMEDFDVTLSLLRLGYANAVVYQYAWGQAESNLPGGCSGYRNNEIQDAAAKRLAERHPGFVNVVKKKAKSGWEGMEERTDVIIQWKKAYESSNV